MWVYHVAKFLELAAEQRTSKFLHLSLGRGGLSNEAIFETLWTVIPMWGYIVTSIVCGYIVVAFDTSLVLLPSIRTTCHPAMYLSLGATATIWLLIFLHELIRVSQMFNSRFNWNIQASIWTTLGALADLCDIRSPIFLELYQKRLRRDSPTRRGRSEQGQKCLYQYQPIQESDGIRLIRLLDKTEKSSPSHVECELVHVSLCGAPAYDAISYTWGNPQKDCGIVVNGEWLPTSANVYEILHGSSESAFSWASRYIWIDFLCINQDDCSEKNQQVPMMRKIYLQAAQVIISLGNPQDYAADIAIQHIRDLHSAILQKRWPYKSSAAAFDRRFFKLWFKLSRLGWDAFSTLLKHPLWTRVWIVQELALAKKLWMVYGDNVLDWEEFILVLKALCKVDYDTIFATDGDTMFPISLLEGKSPWDGIALISRILHIRETVQAGDHVSFEELMMISPYLASTDPRDHVFGLEGLVTSPIVPQLLPDYGASRTVESLYIDVAHSFLRQSDHLWFLHLAGIGFPRNYNDLPSWVPDWSTETENSLIKVLNTIQTYSIVRPSSLPAKNQKILSLEGNSIGVICKLTTLPIMRSPVGKAAMDNSTAIRTSLINGIKEVLEITSGERPESYPNGEPYSEATWRAIVGGGYKSPAAASLGQGYEILLFLIKVYDASTSGEKNPEFDEPQADMWEKIAMFRDFVDGALTSVGRKFAILSSGHFALVPGQAAVGDSVFCMCGITLPLVLREKNKTSEGSGSHELVGDSYVHGLTDEFLRETWRQVEKIDLF